MLFNANPTHHEGWATTHNAQLTMKCANPDTGMINDAEFEVVPYLRFRKSLSTIKAPLVQSKSLAESAQLQERTVFIINSTHLGAFLKETEILLSGFGKWPWDAAIILVPP